jgi:uncharacterized protein (DUF2237 family)
MSTQAKQKNVLGGELQSCSVAPLTGFFRDGCCNTCDDDTGSHTVCVVTTAKFLAFSKAAGNDLSTPIPQYRFPGVKPGQRWCVCAGRWLQAVEAGAAAPVVLEATNERALEIIPMEIFKAHAFVPGYSEGEHVN